MEAHEYNVQINWNQERKGLMCSPELREAAPTGQTCIEVATPPQFEKGHPGIWSPEHLFTASVSSCLMTTFLAIAEYSKLEFSNFSCNSKGILDKEDKRFVVSEVILEPVITIKNEKDRDKAMRVLEKSEKACLISNSIKSKITMNSEVLVKELVG